MQRRQRACQRQAEAESALGAIERSRPLRKGSEERRPHFFGNSRSIVFTGNHCRTRSLRLRSG